MQILSIGEKIRKVRISKNMTLKGLCEKDISVSKMSNIENGKIKPDEKTLKIISKRLDIDVESLNKSTVEEARDKIEELSGKFSSINYEKEFKSLLRSCIEYNLKPETFMARAQIVEYYMYKGRKEKLVGAISNLHSSLVNTVNNKTMFIYILTMGKYFLFMREYEKAIVYLSYLKEKYDKTSNEYIMGKNYEVLIYLSYAFIYQNKIEEASIYINILQNEIESKTDLNPDIRLKINILLYTVKLLFNNEISIKKLSNNIIGTIEDSFENYSSVKYFVINKKIEDNDLKGAIEEIVKLFKISTKNNHKFNTGIIIKVMEDIVEKKEYKEGSNYIDIVLNAAIKSDSRYMMEKAYYFKSKILYTEGKYDLAERYMWISIDLLNQIGRTDNISERYEELGNIYLKLDKKKEAIKYYNLSNYNDSIFNMKKDI